MIRSLGDAYHSVDPGRPIGSDISRVIPVVDQRQPLFDAIRASTQFTEHDVCAEGWTLHAVQIFERDENGKVRRLGSEVQRRTIHLDAKGAERWQAALRKTGVIA